MNNEKIPENLRCFFILKYINYICIKYKKIMIMKHLFYLVLIFVLTNVTIVNAQVPISLTYDGNDVTNSEVTMERDLKMHFHVTNTGTSDMDIRIEITEINIPPGVPGIEVCWGICTVPPGPMLLGVVNVKAGETNTDDFYLTYNTDGNTESADIFFHVYEEGISNDFITLSLDTDHVGVNNADEKELISIYPNPATTFFNILVSEELTNTKIVITNIIGKTVKIVDLKRSDNRFSAGELLSGIYFVSLIKGKNVLTTKKLIVN